MGRCALFGSTGLTGVPNLIADMNSQHLAFSVHNGDLKGGGGTPGSVTPATCVDALYVQGVNFFNALQAPGDVHARRQRLDGL